MKTIVAIGGGEIARHETLAIDKEIIRLSGKKSPTVLFIPTASSDAQGYIDTFTGLLWNAPELQYPDFKAYKATI